MCAYVYPFVRMYLSAPCVRVSMLIKNTQVQIWKLEVRSKKLEVRSYRLEVRNKKCRASIDERTHVRKKTFGRTNMHADRQTDMQTDGRKAVRTHTYAITHDRMHTHER